jgi:replicative DNA helicase
VPAVWGRDGDVAQSQGERLMIVGPQGVGKTALTEQHALRRAGILEGDLLEMPVEVSAGRVLYIAADRPRQAARSFRRMVTEADREALKTGLIVWRGPLPFDLGRCERGDLAEFVDNFPEVTDVYVDALKDCAVKLTDDEVGSRVSNEFAELIAREIEVVVDHHQRKKGPGNAKPTSLADVYGSTWITTGCGSVLLLWGDAGDAIVELSHLKQPAGEVGPLTLVHDHERGTVDVHQPADLYEMARAALGSGLTARSAAMRLYDTSDPDRNQIEKARGRLKRHPKLAIVEGTDPAAWRPM